MEKLRRPRQLQRPRGRHRRTRESGVTHGQRGFGYRRACTISIYNNVLRTFWLVVPTGITLRSCTNGVDLECRRMYYIALYCIASHRIAPHRIAPHRTASHRTASHRIAPHRTASHRIASYHIASYHIAPYHIAPYHTSYRAVLHCCVGTDVGGVLAA